MRKKIGINREAYTGARLLTLETDNFKPSRNCTYKIVVRVNEEDVEFKSIGQTLMLSEKEFVTTEYDLLIKEKANVKGLLVDVNISVWSLIDKGYEVWLIQ